MLTFAQQEARAGKLTASKVGCLMRGNAEEILHLYKQFLGEEIEEDLSKVWPVQLGAATEQLNLDWLEAKGTKLSRRGEVVVHRAYDWAACTLDAWVDDLGCPCEAKHVAGREPLEVIIDRYQPQMHWQMIVTGATQCALSVIMGANEPIVEFIPIDHDYAQELRNRAFQFMDHVRRRVPPVELAPVLPPADASKIYDMTSNNLWASQAADWLANWQAGKTAEAASKALKEIVPADAKKVTGHGVRVTRDRAGRLSLRVDE
jgi:hypothetical protein